MFSHWKLCQNYVKCSQSLVNAHYEQKMSISLNILYNFSWSIQDLSVLSHLCQELFWYSRCVLVCLNNSFYSQRTVAMEPTAYQKA